MYTICTLMTCVITKACFTCLRPSLNPYKNQKVFLKKLHSSVEYQEMKVTISIPDTIQYQGWRVMHVVIDTFIACIHHL